MPNSKEYLLAHRDEIRAYNRAWYQAHREQRKAEGIQYYKDNRNKILLQKQQYDKKKRIKRQIYIKQYNKDHPEVGLRAQKKQMEKRKNNGFSPYDFMAWSNVIRKGKNCSYCDSNNDLHAHHLISKTRFPGLALSENNGITLCATCHREHHSLNGATA